MARTFFGKTLGQWLGREEVPSKSEPSAGRRPLGERLEERLEERRAPQPLEFEQVGDRINGIRKGTRVVSALWVDGENESDVAYYIVRATTPVRVDIDSFEPDYGQALWADERAALEALVAKVRRVRAEVQGAIVEVFHFDGGEGEDDMPEAGPGVEPEPDMEAAQREEEERERARLEAQKRREEAERAEAALEAQRLRLDLEGNPIDCENTIRALLEGNPGAQWRLHWSLQEKGPVEPGTRLEFERGARGREAAEEVSIRFGAVRNIAGGIAITFLIDGEPEPMLGRVADFIGYDRMTVHGGEVDPEAAALIADGDLEGEVESPDALNAGAPLYLRTAFLNAHMAGMRQGRGRFMLNGKRVFFHSLEGGRLQYTRQKSQKRPDTVDFTKDRLGLYVSSGGGRAQGGLRRMEYDGRSRRMGTTVPAESAGDLATALYGEKQEAAAREEVQIYADTTGWEALPPYSSEGDILRVCDTVGRGGLLEIDGVVARLRGYRPGTTRVTVEYIVGKETPVDLRNCTVRYAPGLEEQVVAEKVENDEAAPAPSTPAAVVVQPPEEEVAQPKRLEKGASREEVEEFFKGLIPGAVTLRIDGGALTAEYRGRQGRSVILFAGSEFVWPISEHSFEVVEVTDEEEMMPEPVPARTQPTSGRRRIKTSAVARSAAASPSSGVERPSIRRRSGPAHWGSSVDLKQVDARLGRSGNDEKK